MNCRLALATVLVTGCAGGFYMGPEATLVANGSTELDAKAGDMITYTWTSSNADTASSSVSIEPHADACGNSDGPWVVASLAGETEPSPLLACQRGFNYDLTFTVVQSDTGDTAQATVRINVQQ
ncbi:MAG TPA: hypothetical protein VGO00_13450 [Kofleriaceae bacterium]|nr:hypothetical protein [Kofleriaceae bacterium]